MPKPNPINWPRIIANAPGELEPRKEPWGIEQIVFWLVLVPLTCCLTLFTLDMLVRWVIFPAINWVTGGDINLGDMT